MNCPKGERKINEGFSNYCNHCGYRLNSSDAEEKSLTVELVKNSDLKTFVNSVDIVLHFNSSILILAFVGLLITLFFVSYNQEKYYWYYMRPFFYF
jgi:hypothetical protein